MAYENILVEKKDGIATVTMNNPKSLNALNTKTLEELKDAFAELEVDKEAQVIVLTGAGRSFVAGADIKEMKDKTVDEAATFAKLANFAFTSIERCSKPVIAAVNGFALGGGCELCLSCDIRLASTKALFGQPEVGLGITPGFGGTQRLPRVVGLGEAKRLIFTAKNIKADEAKAIGLVSAVYEPEQLLEEAYNLAKDIMKNGPLAVQYAKEAINFGMQTDIITGLDIERNQFAKCFGTEDQTEGMTGFVEKRDKHFQGK